MRHLGKIGILSVLFGGCSLIVGSKLDEKGDAGISVSDGRPATPVTIRPERGKPYAVVGEWLELTSSHLEWQQARIITLSPLAHPEVKTACIYGGFEQERLRCVIPSQGNDGIQRLSVYTEGQQKLLGEAELDVRRLVMVSGPEQHVIRLYTSEPFVFDREIDLGKKILADRPPPLLSPSGRFLLASLEGGLFLVDLITGVPSGLGGLQSLKDPPLPGTIPHAFEPRFAVVDGSPLPYAPHFVEERVWVVDDLGKLKVFEIAKILAGTPSFVDKQDGVQQILWGASPKLLANPQEQARGLVVRKKDPLAQTHFLVNHLGQLSPVTIASKSTPLQAVHALPAQAKALVRELVFLLMLEITSGKNELIAIREDGSVESLGHLTYFDKLVSTPLVPTALVTIPWTSLVGFNFDSYPPATGTLLHGLLLLDPKGLRFEVEQDAAESAGLAVATRRHEVQPTMFTAWRMLVHDGDAAATFERGQVNPGWQLLGTGFTGLVHHPRQELIYAITSDEVRRYAYSDKAPGVQKLTPPMASGGVYIQP